MDAIKNPLSPGAGSPPPELVGREGILEQARVLLGRIKEQRSAKSILLTGLRGVGKTVLLNEIERLAVMTGYRTIAVEAHEDKSLVVLVVPPLRKLLFELDRVAGAGDKANRALAVLKGFMDGVKVKLLNDASIFVRDSIVDVVSEMVSTTNSRFQAGWWFAILVTIQAASTQTTCGLGL